MGRAMNGEGSFRRISKDGESEKWTGRKQFGYKQDGKPNIKAVYGKSEKECKRKMRAFEEEYRKSKGIVDNRTVFIDYLKSWFETFKKPEIKRRTYNTLQDVITNRIEPYDISHYQLHELTPEVLQKYITSLGLDERVDENGNIKPPYARDSVIKTYNLIRGCLQYAYKKGCITNNPMELVHVPSEEVCVTKVKDITFFEKEDMWKIYKEATKKYSNGKYIYSNNGLAIVLLMFTGLRIGEALGLNWGDYNKANHTLSVNKQLTIERDDDMVYHRLIGTPKSKNAIRIIPISDIASGIIEALYLNSNCPSEDLPILSTKTGNRANPRNLRRTLNTIQENAKTKIQNSGLHTLRHTFVSYLLNEGNVSIKVISDLVGHHSPDITMRVYAHTIDKQKINATDSFNSLIQDSSYIVNGVVGA